MEKVYWTLNERILIANIILTTCTQLYRCPIRNCYSVQYLIIDSADLIIDIL